MYYTFSKRKNFGRLYMGDHFDIGSLLVILATFVLFTIALFTKGFTHDLLLEAGVFLVSVKLIIMAYKISVSSKRIEKNLEKIEKALQENQEE